MCFCLLFLFRSDNRSYQVKKISKPGLRYDATVRCQYDIRLVFWPFYSNISKEEFLKEGYKLSPEKTSYFWNIYTHVWGKLLIRHIKSIFRKRVVFFGWQHLNRTIYIYMKSTKLVTFNWLDLKYKYLASKLNI